MPGPARPAPARRRRGVLVVGLAVWALGLGACSDPPTPTRPQVQKALRTSGFSATASRCITDQLFATLTPKELEAVAENGPSRIPAEKSTKLSTGISRCNDGTPADGANTTTTSPAPSSTTTTPPDQPTTSGGVATGGAGAGGAGGSSTTAPASTTEP